MKPIVFYAAGVLIKMREFLHEYAAENVVNNRLFAMVIVHI